MDNNARRHPYLDDLDGEIDEELPDYEPHDAPVYDDDNFDVPILTYHLRQVNRKLQILVPFGPSATTSYRIASSTTFRFFSRKPDLALLRISLAEQQADDCAASIHFESDGPLPWRPRARFSHIGMHGNNTYEMESKNFQDWSILIGGLSFTWELAGRPISLALSEQNSNFIIARFTYSGCGTLAANGAEVGDLQIYRDALSVDRDGVEKIICSLLVTLVHFKRMGRHYWNDAPVRALSLTRDQLPPRRGSARLASFASYSGPGV